MKVSDEQLQNLMNANIEPDSSWQNTALENIKKSVTNSNGNSINNSNLNFISQFMLKRKVLVMVLVVFAMLSVVVSGGLVYLTLSNQKQIENQQAILQKIAAINQGRTQTTASTAAGADAARSYESKLIAPYLPYTQSYKYNYSKTTTTKGPKYNTCNYGYDLSNQVFVPIYESYSYSEADGTYYAKYVGYSEDNSVNSYSLSKNITTSTSSKSEYTTYMGGSYAVKSVSEYQFDDTVIKPISVEGAPAETTPSTEPNLDAVDSTTVSSDVVTTESTDLVSFFGGNAEVLRTESINGKDYYVIQTAYQTDCINTLTLDRWNSDNQHDYHTMYSVIFASVDDYQIYATETYLDSVSADSLVQRYQSEVQTSDIEFASVSSNFEFEFNVPVKEVSIDTTSITYPTYDADAEIQKAINYAKSENITLVLPSNSVSNEYAYLNYYNAEDTVYAQDNYYSDRDFFPTGEIGDKMFSQYNSYIVGSTVPVSLGSVNYANGDYSYNINIYSSSEDKLKILNNLLWSEIRNKGESSETITINGESVTATLYSYEIDQPLISPLATSAEGTSSSLLRYDPSLDCTTDCFKKQFVLMFEYKNNIYTLQKSYFGSESLEVSYDSANDGLFKSLSVDTASELTQITELITNSIKGNVGSGVVEPVMY